MAFSTISGFSAADSRCLPSLPFRFDGLVRHGTPFIRSSPDRPACRSRPFAVCRHSFIRFHFFLGRQYRRNRRCKLAVVHGDTAQSVLSCLRDFIRTAQQKHRILDHRWCARLMGRVGVRTIQSFFLALPWNLLAHSQYRNLPVIQIADVTGVYGISFLMVMVNQLLSQLPDSAHL